MFYHLHNICVMPGTVPLTNEHIIIRQDRDWPAAL